VPITSHFPPWASKSPPFCLSSRRAGDRLVHRGQVEQPTAAIAKFAPGESGESKPQNPSSSPLDWQRSLARSRNSARVYYRPHPGVRAGGGSSDSPACLPAAACSAGVHPPPCVCSPSLSETEQRTALCEPPTSPLCLSAAPD
jgi:hypothetical protein